MNKCDWCFNGVCEYFSSYEEQEEDENFSECDGTLEDQTACGRCVQAGEENVQNR